MTATTTLQRTLVPTLRQDCLHRQELALLYKALAKHEPCPQKREVYRALASQAEVGLLRPAQRLSRLGEPVPAFQKTWRYRLKQRLICALKRDHALDWLQQEEQQRTQRYQALVRGLLSRTSPKPCPPAPISDQQTLQAMLYPRSRYYGPAQPDRIAFNAAFQDFSNRVAIICSLETGGKIPPAEAMARLERLWDELKADRMRQRLREDLPNATPE